MLNVSRSRSFWMLMLIIAVVRMGETQATESEAQVNSIKSLEPQSAATNRSSGIPKKGNIPAQLLKCFLSSPLTLKDMVKIITQAPNKSPTLAFTQLLQIRQARETATQFHTSVLKGTSRIRGIHAAVITNALWERTATVLNTRRPAASPAAGERSAATETACAAPAIAAATISASRSQSVSCPHTSHLWRSTTSFPSKTKAGGGTANLMPRSLSKGYCCARHFWTKICKPVLRQGEVCTKQRKKGSHNLEIFQRCDCAKGLACKVWKDATSFSRSRLHVCQRI
ncbi:Dickkopf-related protein 2 [Labeo rohita]|uniref:Dickkopf-related protein 2 n=2 Tax=Labeonini TaxID=2743697 RepID=A0ABQ8MZE0_LABRO|nr:Dickkopf-related protein 2 [Labeo rohita]